MGTSVMMRLYSRRSSAAATALGKIGTVAAVEHLLPHVAVPTVAEAIARIQSRLGNVEAGRLPAPWRSSSRCRGGG